MSIPEKSDEKHLKALAIHLYHYVRITILWVAVALAVGLLGGAAGSLFAVCIEKATGLREANPWLVYLLPVAGLAIWGAINLFRMPDGYGTDQIIAAARTPVRIPLAIAPVVFLASAITHVCGGSAGKEGAALQIGGSIGYNVGRLLKMDEKNRHVMTMCGMAAVFSAVLRAPLTAAVFVMEVLSVGEMYYGSLVPCLTASYVAYAIALKCGLSKFSYNLALIPEFSWASVGQTVAIAACCAVVSIVFCLCLRRGHEFAEQAIKNKYLRIVAGGAAVVLLTLLVGNGDYNGAGMDVIARAMGGNAAPEAFLLKIAFTALTMCFGFKGGEIVPSFFVGATLGCTLAPLFGMNAGFGAALGLICMFCGVVNCPISSIILGVELFGSGGLLLFALGATFSYTLSGYYGLYGSQKIIYSKTRSEFVDKYTNK